jgi:hypothetical protein
MEMLDKEVQRMLEMKAIKVSTRKDLILSSIYTVPKKNGKRRPVINLRWVNEHIEKKHFKMSTMRDVKQALTKNCWMASLDLTDCFWGLALDEQDQRACAFQWRGTNYVFRCLPFGLSLSPFFITKLYRNVVEHLQAQGHRVIIYIDDILILGKSKQQCMRSVQAVRDCLQSLGARINEEKSHPTPTQKLEYLGFELDSKEMKIWAPTKKLQNTKKALKGFLRGGTATPRDAASILGKLNSLSDAMLPARVRTAEIHDFKLKTLRNGSWDKKATIPQAVVDDANWWLKSLQALNGRDIHPPAKDYDAGTDASDFGWGAWIRTPNKLHRWGGLFTKEEAKEHINFKEMLAVKYFLQSCPVDLQGKTVDMGIDNTTTIWYLRRWGGRNMKLAKLTTEIYDLTTWNKIKHVVTHHCPGELNLVADEESRKKRLHGNSSDKDENNFQDDFSGLNLNSQLFGLVDSLWGPHTVDLFATLQDRQVQRFCSWGPQPGALTTDALRMSWRGENGWVNPPFSLIFRVLHKVRLEGSTISLLAPFWPSSPWFPLLLDMLVDAPVLLPRIPAQFQHPLLPHGKTPQWLTLVWRISGSRSLLKASKRRLSRRFCKPGSRQLARTMTCFGVAGLRSPNFTRRIQSLLMSLYFNRGWQN